jgi:hypothetical protein
MFFPRSSISLTFMYISPLTPLIHSTPPPAHPTFQHRSSAPLNPSIHCHRALIRNGTRKPSSKAQPARLRQVQKRPIQRHAQGSRDRHVSPTNLPHLTTLLRPRSAVKNARDSPLLAIPAEVRTMIWEYALCNHPVKAHYKHRWELPAHPTDMCQPLRVWRQIYSEAAVHPLSLYHS